MIKLTKSIYMSRRQKSENILRKFKEAKGLDVNQAFALLSLQLYVKNNFKRRSSINFSK